MFIVLNDKNMSKFGATEKIIKIEGHDEKIRKFICNFKKHRLMKKY